MQLDDPFSRLVQESFLGIKDTRHDCRHQNNDEEAIRGAAHDSYTILSPYENNKLRQQIEATNRGDKLRQSVDITNIARIPD
jgi:hypothetical protein